MVTIVCSRCGGEALAKRKPAKFCSGCRAEVRREVKARSAKKNIEVGRAAAKRWRAANPERYRELERRREAKRRDEKREYCREYMREKRRRDIAVRAAPLWAAAAAEVSRTWLALAAGPTPEEKAGPCRPLVCEARRRFVAGFCPECDEAFVYCHSGGPIRRFCSPLHGKRYDRRQRRERKIAAFVEPVFRRKVFERDGWRCQLCKRLVSRTAVVPHPRAATIDHIVPLAKDGEHSMANVHTAHFMCNSEKGAQARNEQLRLVG